jgi:hypothetical protein
MARQAEKAKSNGEPEVSGFGGHRIASATTQATLVAAAAPAGSLSTLWFEDAEQLVAASAVPGLDTELKDALGLSDADYQAIVDTARQLLPPDRLGLVSTPTSTADLHLGALEPPDDMREEPVAVAAAVLPGSVNLIPGMPPIRNQASRGTCVSFTMTAMNEYFLRRNSVVEDLSEQHLYAETKAIDGAPNQCGTFQAKAAIVLRQRGECRESVWPYNPNPPCNNHGVRPPQARPDGLHYGLNTHTVPTNDMAAYKAELAQSNPVGLSIPVYNSWYASAETRRSGRITMRVGNEQRVGGHAVLLVGYQDTPDSPGGGYFLVRNHWSTTWAYQSPYGAGYGTIPYQYITNDAWEAFAADLPVGSTEAQEETARPSSSVVITVGPDITITINSR